MVRLPRIPALRPLVALAVVCLSGLAFLVVPSVRADDPAATQSDNKAVMSLVENYWHYGKIARYDLASAEGKKLLELNAPPADVLAAFEKVSSDRRDNLYDWLNRWQRIDAMSEVNAKIVEQLSAGSLARKSDPAFIKSNIERLSVNERGYAQGLASLRQSGELAIPFMIDYLRDPSKTQYHGAIRRGMRDLGRYALSPLCAATQMKDNDTLVIVTGALGDLGYDAAVPYLNRLIAAGDTVPAVKDAASRALTVLGVGKGGNVADQFFALGEKLYYNNSAIASDTRNPMGFIWYWDDAKGLYKIDVPHPIFGDLMCMRECEYALKQGGGTTDALSLWVGANYKREADLPEGAKDATRGENQPNANYYGVTAGSQYVNSALARALHDSNSAVALKAITSLQQIAGQSALPGSPLIDAMSFPDRRVRFEAAFALAASLPQQGFAGQERVVPLLAEALSQTGTASVVIAMPTQDAVNGLVESMKSANGYNAAGATSAEAAVAAANSLPAVDVILAFEDLGVGEVDKLIQLASTNPKLQGAAKVIVTTTPASPYVERAANDKMLSTTQARDAAGLKPAVEAARSRAGSLPMDPAVATDYAMRSGQLMTKLAIARGQVMDLTAAKPTLLAALDDTRAEIVKLSGQVLGLISVKESQASLLSKAADEKTADDVKISLYQSMATNARFFGNQLDAGQIDTLSKIVENAQNLDVRGAAAQARGALNLPADQAKGLIVNQSRM